MSARWSDEEFLGYVEIHSCTERALFSRDQVARLLQLAGDNRPLARTEEWIAVHSDVAYPLIERARKRLKQSETQRKFRVIKGGKK